jgi:hypothetical protein
VTVASRCWTIDELVDGDFDAILAELDASATQHRHGNGNGRTVRRWSVR